MTIRYSYGDFTTKGHGVIEGSWGKKTYQTTEIEAQKVKNLPPNLKVKQTSKNYYSLKIPGRSSHGPVMKEIKAKIDSGQTIKINDTTFIRRNTAKEYELLSKSKKQKGKTPAANKVKERDSVDSTYNHLMQIHNAANRK